MLSHINSTVDRLKEFRRKVVRDYKNVPVRKRSQMNKFYHEICIESGYRGNYSFIQTIYSFFRATNETMNFWTHFLPFVYFMYRFYLLSQSFDFSNDPYVYPMYCYMVSISLFTLVSALAHGFACTTPMMNHICFLMDYSAISFYSWGAGLVYYSYSLSESFHDSWYSAIFLPVGATLAVLATLCACCSRFVNAWRLKKFLKLFAFCTPFIWDSVPLIMRLSNCSSDAVDSSCDLAGRFHVIQFISINTACFFYCSHIPEIIFPGRFDIVGHSHNLLHIFGALATYHQMEGSLIDMVDRKDRFLQTGFLTDPIWSNVVTPFVIFADASIIGISAFLLSRKPEKLFPFLDDSCCSSKEVSDGPSKKSD